MGAMLLSLPFIGRAQHGISYNQFGQLRNSFNSSLSTMDDRGSFSVLGRSQWVGVDGAPKSIWATGNAVIKPIGLSVGGDVKHSELGIVKESEFSVFAAKAVRLSEDEYLSLSMGGRIIVLPGELQPPRSE